MGKSKPKSGKRSSTEESKTEIVNVRLPKDLIANLDSLVKNRIFNSRSEAIREFARKYVLEKEHENAKISERGGGRW